MWQRQNGYIIWRRQSCFAEMGHQMADRVPTRLFIFVAVTATVVALAWWLLMSPLRSFPEAHKGDGRTARYGCEVDENGASHPSVLTPWRGAKLIRDRRFGAQFLLADGRTIHPTWFPAETGAIGGSIGLRWTAKNGVEKAAILNFSDIVLEDDPSDVHIDIGNWSGMPKFYDSDGWADVTLHCTLESE